MVLMTVAIRRLNERSGQLVDVLGSGQWTRPLLQGQPGVGDLYLMGSRHRPYGLAPDQWRLVESLRRRGAGPTWLFDPENDKTLWLLRRAGWHDAQLIGLDRLADIPGEHFCDRWWRFAQLEPPSCGAVPQGWEGGGATAVAPRTAVPHLQVPPSAGAQLDSWLAPLGVVQRPFILIQVGNKRTMRRGLDWQRPSNTKYWPEAHWASVLRDLRQLHQRHALLLLGAGHEAALNDQILALAGVSDAYNLAPHMTVERLMALCERATGMISVDTGPAHVAAALSCPILALFDSHEKRLMYEPRGPAGPAACLTGGEAAPSLQGILPEQVLAAWNRMITSERNPAARQAQ
jgi:heptosyltransferase-2/heptosyltransferase-3